MADQRKFMRFVGEFEVEVSDAVAAKTALMSADQDGRLRVADGDEDAFTEAIQVVLSQALVREGPTYGLELIVATVRPRHSDGRFYPAEWLSAMPVRNADGSLGEVPPLEPPGLQPGA